MSEWSLRFASVAAVCVSKTNNVIAVFVKDPSLTVGYCDVGLSSRMSSSVPLSQSHSIVLHSLARGCLHDFQ